MKNSTWLLPGKKELESLTGRKALELPSPAIDGIWASIGTADSRGLSDPQYMAVVYGPRERPRTVVISPMGIKAELVGHGPEATLGEAIRSIIIRTVKGWE